MAAKKKTQPMLPAPQLVAERFRAAGISQSELSKLLGRSPSAVARWKTDGAIPNMQRDGQGTYDRLLEVAEGRQVRLTLQELLTGGVP